MTHAFTRIAGRAAELAGHYLTFVAALLFIALWAVTGPLFGFSDTWQLVINTGTTVVTFLMVFLIQHTQNRDAAAVHLKLDELLRAVREADTALIDVEDQSDEEIAELKRLYAALCQEHESLKRRLEQQANLPSERREELAANPH